MPILHSKRSFNFYLQAEDDGVVLSAVLRAKGIDSEVFLLVLDASSFTELARVTFKTSGPVPKCLHGWFVPQQWEYN